jgi:AcrR family transcriptional regulator
MAGRRTDTRERIQRVALELFAERGYERTTLSEVAERLQITRPALYYHFKAKEDILNSVIEDLLASIDGLVSWAHAQPATSEARHEILRRLAALLEGQWRPLVGFAQVNQGAMNDAPVGERLRTGILALLSVVTVPGADKVKQFESKLAVFALILGSVPFLFELDLPEEERATVALTVAMKLISD